MTPEQQLLGVALNSRYRQQPMSYLEWLAVTGQLPQQQAPQRPDVISVGRDLAKDYGKSYLKDSLLGSSSGVAGNTPSVFNIGQSGMAGIDNLGGWTQPSSSAAMEGYGLGATPYLGAAGAGLGAYGIYNSIKANNPKMGALSGAGMGAGLAAAAPLIGLGPVGWGTMGLMALGGAGLGGGLAAAFGDKNRYQDEWKRKKKLYDQGLISEQQLGQMPTSGRSDAELIQRAEQSGGNVAFAKSRNESDLTPQDIQGYASILEQAAKTGQDRTQLAADALASGAVREHHGTIDVDWNKVKAGSGASVMIPKAPAAPGPKGVSIDPGFNQTIQQWAKPGAKIENAAQYGSNPTSLMIPKKKFGVTNPITGR